jgi:hypothetical protein
MKRKKKEKENLTKREVLAITWQIWKNTRLNSVYHFFFFFIQTLKVLWGKTYYLLFSLVMYSIYSPLNQLNRERTSRKGWKTRKEENSNENNNNKQRKTWNYLIWSYWHKKKLFIQ